MNWITVSFYTAGAVMFGLYGARDLWRTFAMKRLAKRLGFVYLRHRLPEALSLYGTPFAFRRFTWNVVDGECNRMRVVVFDCRQESDKGIWRTVIAVRTGSTARSAAEFGSGMMADSSGGWTILYYPPEVKTGLMPMKELRTRLSSI